MNMSNSNVNKPQGSSIDMKRILVLVGDGFSDEEVQKARVVLENAFKGWKDTTVFMTNKEFKPIRVDTDAWAKMEKDLE